MSVCRWCAEGKPKWSAYANVWIHRRSTIDKRCENPPNDNPQEPAMHECNDCGILTEKYRPICTLCERWYEERGMELPK